MSDPPKPPGILAEYVVDALQRQSVEKLDAIQQYIQELREYQLQQQEIDEEELLENPDVVETQDHPEGDGYFVVKKQRCGADCTCNDDKGHGPYLWHVTDGGDSWECKGKVEDGRLVHT